MKIFFKIITLLITLIVCFLGGKLLYDQWQSKVVTLYPLPYQWVEDLDARPDLVKAPPHILFVGDRHGVHLASMAETLRQKLPKDVQEQIEIESWAEEHEGLHRTLKKLQQFSKWPSLIIYMGGSEEFYEKKFYYNEMGTILKNLAIYQDSKWPTLLNYVPYASKILYEKTRLYPLWHDIKMGDGSITDLQKLKMFEITFKLYKFEFQTLLEMVRQNNSQLMVITPPLPLGLPPEQVCSFSSTPSVKILQERTYDFLAAKDYKSAYETLLPLKVADETNALTYYLLGLAAAGLSRWEESTAYFKNQLNYDCAPHHGHLVFNAIMKKESHLSDVTLIDFDAFVNRYAGKMQTFETESKLPVPLFYQDLLEEMAKKVRLKLRL